MDVKNTQLPKQPEPAPPHARKGRSGGVERIEFPSWNPYLPRDMWNEDVRNRRIPAGGCLFLPDASFLRPRPAVIIVQGLGGPKKQREIAYGRFLARQGYVVLTTSSFATRGVHNRPQVWRALRVTTAMLMADAFGALDYLSNHPQVAPDRIAVVGFSFGGMISLLTAYRRMHDLYLRDGPAFAAHVSYYGSSIPRLEDPTTTGAPALVMLGRKDKNVSVPRTEEIVGDLRRGGSRVDFEIFDAYHQWDGPHLNLHWTLFHLRDCHIRINNDGSIMDEKSGHRIEGPWSRFWFLLRNSAPLGYLMKRDSEIMERSNALLLSFLQKELFLPGASPRHAETPPRSASRQSLLRPD